MASEYSFAYIVLNELELPEDLLAILEARSFDLLTLVNISKDQLADVLLQTQSFSGHTWNIDEIFRRIICWRQKHGHDIIGFTQVEVDVEESWVDSPPEEEEKSDSPDRKAEELLDQQENYSLDIAATDPSNTAIDLKQLSVSTDNPFSETSSDNAAATVFQPASLQAVPSTSSRTVEIVTQKNADDCASCSKHFSPTTLVRLLEPSKPGKYILESGALGPLSTESQKDLAAIIADYHRERGAETTKCILEEYVDSITALFKSECKDTYFIARAGSKRNHGGKLYNRIVNSTQSTANRKLKEEAHLSKIQKKENPPSIEDKAATEAAVWLQQNTKPWSTTLDKWTLSFPSRKSFLAKPDSKARLFNEYQHYSDQFGYQLVDIDFHLLRIGDREGWKKWQLLLPKIIQYIDKPYKEEPSKSVLEVLKSSNVSQCQQICAVLLLLNNFLRPTKVTRTFKPSILFAQEEILSFAVTDEQALEKVRELTSICSSYGISSIARLVVRGQDIQSLTGVFEVHYDGTVYRLDTAAKAIDVLVKFNSVFGLKFSRISRLVWNFICSFIYDIQVQEQYESINKLKQYLRTE